MPHKSLISRLREQAGSLILGGIMLLCLPYLQPLELWLLQHQAIWLAKAQTNNIIIIKLTKLSSGLELIAPQAKLIIVSQPQLVENSLVMQINNLMTYYQQSQLSQLPLQLMQLQALIAASLNMRGHSLSEQAVLIQLQQQFEQLSIADIEHSLTQLQDYLTDLQYEITNSERLNQAQITWPQLILFDADWESLIAKISPTLIYPNYPILPISQSIAEYDVTNLHNYANKIIFLADAENIQIVRHNAKLLNSLLNQQYIYNNLAILYAQMLLIILVYSLSLRFFRDKIKLNILLWLLAIWTIYAISLYHGLLMAIIAPMLLIFGSTLASKIQHTLENYQDARRLYPDAAERNRLLGLAFQGQGQLDLAFEQFSYCPTDDNNLSLMYNLALDYELKSQMRKASRVYRYILAHQADFRDVAWRWQQLQQEYTKSNLGRYQIDKQLGKGAMGVVYLGREPKLNRLLAIKTMSLTQEVAEQFLEETIIRFFREASAAGRLQHADIIKIYDAGLELDLAYIAMEYFKGGHLLPYCRADNLLPIDLVLHIVSKVALALDYAHSKQVIHRDIKPANIMYNPATNQIKITDFGIAHIIDTHQTKTGLILGTPSYMAPEQIAGKRVDGRADLFALGVMLYQLLSGTLPFQADSMANLMFKIANEPHLDISQSRAEIPIELKHIIDTALAKNPQQRFQTGLQFAKALRDCSDEAFYAPRNELPV
jgi:hypothetical protein